MKPEITDILFADDGVAVERINPRLTWKAMTDVDPSLKIFPTRNDDLFRDSILWDESIRVGAGRLQMGKPASGWQSARPDKPAPADNLAGDGLADKLFRAYLKLLWRSGHYQYNFQESGSSLFSADNFSADGAMMGTWYANCYQSAREFGFLLWFFGFAKDRLRLEVFPPDLKEDQTHSLLVPKPPGNLAAGNVRLAYEGANPNDEFTNAFTVTPRAAGEATLKASDRAPFRSHYIVRVGGTTSPFFDTITGARYTNGMLDRFSIYRRCNYGIVYAGQEAYVDDSDPRCRVYEIPMSMESRITSPDFVAARAFFNTRYEGVNYWVLTDPADWSRRAKAGFTIGAAREIPGPQEVATTPILLGSLPYSAKAFFKPDTFDRGMI